MNLYEQLEKYLYKPLQSDDEVMQNGRDIAELVYSNPETFLSAIRAEVEREKGCGCPCGEPDQSFCDTCKRIRVEAIKEMLERENPKPLRKAEVTPPHIGGRCPNCNNMCRVEYFFCPNCGIRISPTKEAPHE